MWTKLFGDSLLRVLTTVGSRYIKPSFWQRVYLVWVFRHFETLPLQVLSERTQRLIDELCSNTQNYVSALDPSWEHVPLIGTVERRPPILVEELPPRRPSVGVSEQTRGALVDQQGS
jgi:hypothetical protein